LTSAVAARTANLTALAMAFCFAGMEFLDEAMAFT